jgi:hypothetical protein
MLITVGMFWTAFDFPDLCAHCCHLPSSNWDLVWFGVILTLKVALGQFTPPLAVNLMVSCQTARADGRDRTTVGGGCWAPCSVLVAVIAFPELALWLPRKTGLLANAVHSNDFFPRRRQTIQTILAVRVALTRLAFRRCSLQGRYKMCWCWAALSHGAGEI